MSDTLRLPTDCKLDQHYPAEELCPRCGVGPCENAGTIITDPATGLHHFIDRPEHMPPSPEHGRTEE